MNTEIKLRITEYGGYDAIMVLDDDEEKCKFVEQILLDAGYKYDPMCNCDYLIKKNA